MLPFALGAYMVRDFLVRDAFLSEAAAAAAAPGPGSALGLAHPPAPVSEAAVGRLSGMLGACFCAAQLLTSYPWGRASDALGRRVSPRGGGQAAAGSLPSLWRPPVEAAARPAAPAPHPWAPATCPTPPYP